MLDDAWREWQLAELAAADAELRASRIADPDQRRRLDEEAHALRVRANEALDLLLEHRRNQRSRAAPAPAGGPLIPATRT